MIMSNAEAVELFNAISQMLYMMVAWLSGIYLGYMIGFRNGSGS
jgi:hypothetical protein